VALEIPEPSLHPMHAVVCESSAIDREIILERDVGETTTLLLYVEGDREGYERTLGTLPNVAEWTIDDAEPGFYVYVRTTMREREQLYADALAADSLLVVLPVELRPDRTVRLSLVGHSDALSTAMADLPADVGVEVLWTGTYRREGAVRLSERQRDALAAAWEVG
jgi:hypothetical protein